MVFDVMRMVVCGIIMFFMYGADSATCPSGTVDLNVSSTADVKNLPGVLACTGGGSFNITWNVSVTVERRIDVSDNKNVTVTGIGFPRIRAAPKEDSNAGTTLEFGNGTGLFYVTEGSTLYLNHLLLDGGNAEYGGAVGVLSSSSLFVFSCAFTNNNATDGGAIYSSSSAIYVDGSTSFEDNTAISGGAVYAQWSNISAGGSTEFTNNYADLWGGAISSYESEIVVDGSAFYNNSAGQTGGAIDSLLDECSIRGDVLFFNNSARTRGGAIHSYSTAIFVDGSTSFKDNTALYGGGAIFSSSSAIYVDGSTSFEDNTAIYGGAIYASESNIHIDGDTCFTRNSAESGPSSQPDPVGFSTSTAKSSTTFYSSLYTSFPLRVEEEPSGGAVFADLSNIHVGGSTEFTNNHAIVWGGAISSYESEIVVDGSAFYNNSAGQTGGAIDSALGECSIRGDALFFNNSAYLWGGAMYFDRSKVVIDGNARFSRNWGNLGGAMHVYESEASMRGDILFVDNYATGWGVPSTPLSAFTLEPIDKFPAGALHSLRSEVVIDGSASFTHNAAAYGGGLGGKGTNPIEEALAAAPAMLASATTQASPTCYCAPSARRSVSAIKKFGSMGAMQLVGANLSVRGNVDFSNNSAAEWGGAIFGRQSDIVIDGWASFTHNTAEKEGGALSLLKSNVCITGAKARGGDVSGNQGGLYSEAGGDYPSNWSVAFVDNIAGGLGGAMLIEEAHVLEVKAVLFKSNEAQLGGAIYIIAVEDKQTSIRACLFEDNKAADGGAVYLYTGPGVDIISETVFRNNFASTSGGAIFHTGSMRVFNTSFVANQAGVEGVAITSIGILEALSNVSFSNNTYHCRAGEYGYIVKNKADCCVACFDKICSRCSTGGNGVESGEAVQIDGFPVCAEPPLGAIAQSSGTTIATLPLENGYFRTSNRSHVILKCYQENACRGGNDFEEYCTSGYTGPYCSVCAAGFAPGNSYSCRDCSEKRMRSAVGIIIAVGLAVLLLVAIMLSHLRSVARDANDDQSIWKNKCRSFLASLVKVLPFSAFKIVVTVWQIIYQFDFIAGDVYPELYKTFISKLNPVNPDLDFVFAYSCLVSHDFYAGLVFATTTPLVGLVGLSGSYYIWINRNRGSNPEIQQVRAKHETAVLGLAFFVYSPVSYRIFQTFLCDELDDGNTYLRADYSLSCSSSRHGWYKVYALVMVGVYPIGIAAAFAYLLIRNRGDLLKPDRDTMVHLQPFSGVWAAYKPSRYYYEVIECIRRITLTGIASFVLVNSTVQISIALLFALVYVFVSEYLSPFQKGADMGLYRWGNGIVVASLYVAFLMKIDVEVDTANYLLTFSGVLIAANAFMVVTVLVQTALLLRTMLKRNVDVRMVDVPLRR